MGVPAASATESATADTHLEASLRSAAQRGERHLLLREKARAERLRGARDVKRKESLRLLSALQPSFDRLHTRADEALRLRLRRDALLSRQRRHLVVDLLLLAEAPNLERANALIDLCVFPRELAHIILFRKLRFRLRLQEALLLVAPLLVALLDHPRALLLFLQHALLVPAAVCGSEGGWGWW